ncbi:threonine--tRNA ligase [Candidatus Phytoplasma pini]|uniref:Threonine--tRNA ligase n=1 Tax=Candidatus Phytoplasma pini TaxID=267362 RepID=A0A559KK07_9MOLU|nr:threonine--tRNA ligase [Candidatus Phytoplasma pini]TVY12447.1 threonyl-tRNA synthetase [Candidatus Phytoplasma pini]
MINIRFKHNDVIQTFPKGILINDIISQNFILKKKTPIAALFNNQLVELNRSLNTDGYLEIITCEDPRSFVILNHSTSHLMAQAIKRIYPQALLTIGPAIKEGFYYDIDFQGDIVSDKDFFLIEKVMNQIIQEKLPIVRQEMPKEKVLLLFKDNKYKQIILDKINDSIVSIYTQGEFKDLCRGPHLINTSLIQNFRLLKTSVSYFQANNKNNVLTRIYGIAFFTSKDLKKYLYILEKRKTKDHKNINKEQNFFMLNPEVGLGLPFWLSKGATIRRIIERYIVDKELKYDYQHVYTPILANTQLYEKSGHLQLYQENMFPVMHLKNEEKLILRPMNCPHHMMIFNHKIRSYKELPFKIAELGMMHRYEHSGAIMGLQRTREMTLNDAHIFITENQIQETICQIIDLILEVYKDFNIKEYHFNLSTRDIQNKDKYFSNDLIWDKSENILRNILKDSKIFYKESMGDAAFYGAKLDIQVLNALGHEETLSTIQLDFLLPERFNLSYIGSDNKRHTPVLIHRAVVSTMERFISYLIEKNEGVFPLWLSPVQIILLPVNNQLHLEYLKKIRILLIENNFRVELNDKETSLSYKIRKAQKDKIPYQVVVGDKEINNNLLTFRKFKSDKQKTLSIDDFIQYLNIIINSKK